MALNSIGDDAPAVTEHAHYTDHSLPVPTPEPSVARFQFVVPPRVEAQQQRGGGRVLNISHTEDEEEEIFEEIGPGDSGTNNGRSAVLEDGNIESPYQSTDTVYV